MNTQRDSQWKDQLWSVEITRDGMSLHTVWYETKEEAQRVLEQARNMFPGAQVEILDW